MVTSMAVAEGPGGDWPSIALAVVRVRSILPRLCVAAWLTTTSGCYERFDVDQASHPCGACKPCEACTRTSTGIECVPRVQASMCVDNAVYEENACGERELITDCGEHGRCSATETDASVDGLGCTCEPFWSGPDCDACEPRRSLESGCRACLNHWEGDDCDVCPGNWDPASECGVCRNHWSGDDCNTCPGNWDPDQDCAVCKPCKACGAVARGPTTPQCAPVCGDGIVGNGEACDDGNDVEGDGCADCAVEPYLLHASDLPPGAPAIAANGEGAVMVAWRRVAPGRIGRLVARRFSTSGPVGDRFEPCDSGSHEQVEAQMTLTPDGGVVFVWSGEAFGQPGVFRRAYDVDDQPTSDVLAVTDDAPETTFSAPAIASASDGRYVIAWATEHDGKSALWARAFGADHAAAGPAFALTDESDEGGSPFTVRRSTLAYRDDGSVHAAFPVHLRSTYVVREADAVLRTVRFNEPGAAREVAPETMTAQDAYVTAIALGEGSEPAATWITDGSLWAGLVGAEMVPLAAPLLEFPAGVALTRPANGGFAVASLDDLEGLHLYVLRPGQAEMERAPRFVYEALHDGEIAIARLGDGSYAIVWAGREFGMDLDYSVRTHRFDVEGAPLGFVPPG